MKYKFLIACAILSQTINLQAKEGFKLNKDIAQYKGASFENALRVERNISLDEAFAIAESDSDIDYFVYTKGRMMVLEVPSDVKLDENSNYLNLASKRGYKFNNGSVGYGYCRIFRHGDVVFFKNEGKWFGSAPGLADTYLKINKN
ncbi:MAG: hypothetical protein P0S95_07560 [Rhabdochlamydiaceae bacterium]|nr:hypothetical protein [Candidatus Amphrikana amoebophyrae]